MSRRPKLPFLLVNMAVSADGKIASSDRSLTTFGSARDARHLYELRAGVDAILCGARTIEETGATLGNGDDSFTRRRLRAGLRRHPLRVVVTGSGSLSRQAPLWSRDLGPIVVVTTPRASAGRLAWFRRHAAAVHVSEGPEVDWFRVLAWLRREFGVGRALSEGGGALNDALVRAGVVDELHVTWCPLLLGGRRAPTLADGEGFARLADAARFQLLRCRRVDGERFLVLRARGR